MKQVVRVFGSLGADREQLRVANKLAVDLARVLTSSNRVELFPQLKEGWTRALALQNQLINLSTEILEHQYQVEIGAQLHWPPPKMPSSTAVTLKPWNELLEN